MTNRATAPSRNRMLALAGVALLLAGLLVAAVPALLGMRGLVPDMSHPIAEFDAGAPAVVDLPDADTRYMLMLLLDEPGRQPPELTATVRPLTSAAVETGELNIRANLVGRDYRGVRLITTSAAGAVEVLVEAEASADLAVYRHPADVVGNFIAAVRPWVIVGLVLAAGGLGMLVAAFVRRVSAANRAALG